MKVQTVRRIMQGGALFLVIFIPVLQSYRRLLTYLPLENIGALWHNSSSLTSIPITLQGGYLAWLVIIWDALLGNFLGTIHTLMDFSSLFASFYWSITFSGLTVFDPLSLLQFAFDYHPLSLSFILAVLLPLLLGLLYGAVFCSWLCPINTMMEFNRFLVRKLKIRLPNTPIITTPELRYLVLGLGLSLTLLGIIIFPYILPYAVLGRFFLYLTMGIISWYALIFLLTLFLLDAFVQRGFWCNYLCPTGALLNLLGRRRILRLKHNATTCLEKCSICRATCTWNSDPKSAKFANCTNCYLCIEKCPRKSLKL